MYRWVYALGRWSGNDPKNITIMNRKKCYSISLVLMMAACGAFSDAAIAQNNKTQKPIAVPEGYTGEDSIAYIENATVVSPITANDLLGLAEVHSVEYFLFHLNDFEAAAEYPEYANNYFANHRDSVALRLANRFMRMANVVKLNGNADDKLQWVVAVNKALDDLVADAPMVKRDSAIDEINRVMNKFTSLSQVEMNFMSYVNATVEHYLTIEAYWKWLNEVPANLKDLAHEEYVAWNDLNNARFDLWIDVSYRREWYSMKPMEIEAYYSLLSENRRAELSTERDIILKGKGYKQLGTTVSTAQWVAWIAKSSVPQDKEDIIAMDMADLLPSDSLVTERVSALQSTFSRWLKARQRLAAALPNAQGRSYDFMTADIHCRMIGKLKDIHPFEEF